MSIARTVNVWVNYYVWMMNYCISKHLNWAGICLHNVHYTFVSLSCRPSLYCTYIYINTILPLLFPAGQPDNLLLFFHRRYYISPFFFCFLFIFPSCNSFCCCCFILSPCGEWTAAPALFFFALEITTGKKEKPLAVCLFADQQSPTHTHSSQKEIIKTGTRLFFFSFILF